MLRKSRGTQCHGSYLPASGTFPWRSPVRHVLSSGDDVLGYALTWSVCACPSAVSDSATPRTVASQAPPSMGLSRQEYWSGLPCPLPGESSQPKDQTHISRLDRQILYHGATWGALALTQQ